MLTLLLILPIPDVSLDQCDVIELNHFYDERGRLVFDQVIFWQGDHVMAWRLYKGPQQAPWRDWRQGGYRAVWYDGERLRSVWASSYRESWTQHDPELDDRQKLPKEWRRGLSGEK